MKIATDDAEGVNVYNSNGADGSSESVVIVIRVLSMVVIERNSE